MYQNEEIAVISVHPGGAEGSFGLEDRCVGLWRTGLAAKEALVSGWHEVTDLERGRGPMRCRPPDGACALDAAPDNPVSLYHYQRHRNRRNHRSHRRFQG